MANKRRKKKHWKQQGGALRCTLCGKLLWAFRGDFVSGKSGVVCRQCLRTAYITDLCSIAEKIKSDDLDQEILTPQSLVEQLDRAIAEQPRQTAPIGFLRTAEETGTTVGPEAFVAFGMERELMGRVPGLAAIRPLDEEDLIRILLDKEGSAFSVYRDFFSARGVTLTLSREGARALARRALDLGTGARALKAELDKVMEPLAGLLG